MPSEETITILQQSFSERFADHVFVNSLSLSGQSQQMSAPYYRLALACLAAAASPIDEQRNLARNLFLASSSLWTVMLEVDNREARSLEGVSTVSGVAPLCLKNL